jgi:hypothetical protein
MTAFRHAPPVRPARLEWLLASATRRPRCAVAGAAPVFVLPLLPAALFRCLPWRHTAGISVPVRRPTLSARCLLRCPIACSCPAGRFSAGGASTCTACPPGRFGDGPGAVSFNCTGPCQAGHMCPEGSVSPNATVCPRGRFSEQDSGGCALCSGGRYSSRTAEVSRACEGQCR